MRFFLVLALVALAPPGTAPADDRAALTAGPTEPPPGKRLYAFLEAQARTHFDARRAAVAALKTPRDVLDRQAELRKRFRAALGELPSEKTPLNARVVSRRKREGYSVENVVYESRPGHHVTANFYLPDSPPPCPGVLVPCGHTAEGKAGETYQRLCILLARNGLAALCYDPVGQGERVQALDASGRPAVRGSTAEHTMLGAGALLVGRSAAGYRVWDGLRSLDYLAGRPEVDPGRLGCTGNSGGGTETAYLMALDDRILAAAPSCYVTSLERLFATIGPQDAEQNLTGQVALGVEHADYLTMRAPKPTLLSVGSRDFFDIRGSWDTFREAKQLYCKLGRGGRVDLFESDEPHGLTRPRREACTNWMRRWLLGKDDEAAEAEARVDPEADLRCTRTGPVLTEFPGSKSAFGLNAERADALAKRRGEAFVRRSRDDLRAEIRKRLALPDPGPVLVDGHGNAVFRDNIRIDRWVLATEPGVTVPLLLFRPEPAVKPTQPVVVYVGADRAQTTLGGAIEARARAGETVAVVEPRGTGEATPASPGGQRDDPLGPDWREAFLSLHLNRPLLGQRVFDVLQALRAVAPSEGPPRFHLIGLGAAGAVVLHAAALDDRVTTVEVEKSLVSWSSVAKNPVSRGVLAGVVPGVLKVYDLPDLAASIAPRRLTVREPLGPAGEPVSPEAFATAYAVCQAAYRAGSAEERLTLDAGRRP